MSCLSGCESLSELTLDGNPLANAPDHRPSAIFHVSHLRVLDQTPVTVSLEQSLYLVHTRWMFMTDLHSMNFYSVLLHRNHPHTTHTPHTTAPITGGGERWCIGCGSRGRGETKGRKEVGPATRAQGSSRICHQKSLAELTQATYVSTISTIQIFLASIQASL